MGVDDGDDVGVEEGVDLGVEEGGVDEGCVYKVGLPEFRVT